MDQVFENSEDKINSVEFISNTKEKRQFLFLSDVLEIMAFIVFLVYCILKVSFDLKPVGEPFDLLIIGCGLISTAHVLRIIMKNFKIRSKENKFINTEPSI